MLYIKSHKVMLFVYRIRGCVSEKNCEISWFQSENKLFSLLFTGNGSGRKIVIVMIFIFTFRYLKQIGSALQYCHSNSILHLDVKPKNVIVIAEEKTCKLCDFGSSYDQLNTSLKNNPRKVSH